MKIRALALVIAAAFWGLTPSLRGQCNPINGTGPDVNCQGNVGIGTDPSGFPLFVKRTGANTVGNVYASVLAINPTGNGAGVWFGYDTSTANGTTGAIGSNNTNSALAFFTHDGSAFREALHLAPNGSVGMGTASPQDFLHLEQNAPQGLFLRINNPNPGSAVDNARAGLVFFEGATKKFHIHSAGSANSAALGGPNAAQLINFVNGPMIFGTSSFERVRIATDGSVGIGTPSPSAKLEVFGTGGANIDFKVNGRIQVGDASHYGGMWMGAGPTSYVGQLDANRVGIYGGGSFKFVVDHASGNTGMGTLTPEAKLHVNEGDVLVSRFPADDVTPSYTSMTFRNRGLGGSQYQWRIYAGGPAGAYGVQPNAFEVWEYPGATGHCCHQRLVILKSQTGSAPTPTVVIDGGGNLRAPAALHAVGDITSDGTIHAKYQDIAEWVPSTGDLPPGTVVVLDRAAENQVGPSSSEYDPTVAGVVSPRPGLVLGEAGEGKSLVATTGRVKVRVDASFGPIAIGDLLVTSSKPGIAMRSEPMEIKGRRFHQPGTIIGKALQSLREGEGEILVLLSLQ